MKRIKAMTKQETLAFLQKCAARNEKGTCEECPAFQEGQKEQFTIQCVLRWLDEDPDTVPRIEKIHTVRELADATEEFDRHCDGTTECAECGYYDGDSRRMYDCFLNFLSERVKK